MFKEIERYVLSFSFYYPRRTARFCFQLCWFVCVFVCYFVGLLATYGKRVDGFSWNF